MTQSKDRSPSSSKHRATLRTMVARGERARLVVIAGPEVGRRYTVEEEVLLGRSDEAAVMLDDPQVSRRHARIARIGAEYYIEDLGSRNGTSVNDVPVQRGALSFGDKIGLGDHTVILFCRYGPAEQSILQRQRLEALGRLSAGIAHDLNNTLGVIVATLDYLQNLPSSQEAERAECLEEIRRAAKRAAGLTPRLLAFGRSEAQGHGLVDLSKVCEEVAHLLQRTFDTSINIVTDVKPDLFVVGDDVELHQALMNLCLNARDAMPRGGQLSITAAPAEDHIALTVRDTGEGMDAEVRDRVFEPFFTTKEGDQGSGLGLASVKEFITYHGGSVDVESAPGQGSAFHLRLPKPGDRRRTTSTPSARWLPPVTLDRAAVVLLVDDDDAIRRCFGRVLRMGGYDIVEAVDGEQAVKTYGEHEPKPDVVLLDLNMPKLRGEDALRLIRKLDPEARVLAISGYAEPALKQLLCAAGAIDLLGKPCPAKALLAAVENALHAPLLVHDEPTTGEHDGPLPARRKRDE